MAQVERQREERGENKRSKAKQARGRRAAATGTFQLDAEKYKLLAALTAIFIARGGAVRLGLTRDNGALTVGCYLEDDYAAEYVRPNEDFFASVGEIAEAWIEDGSQQLYEAYAQLFEPR